MKIGVYPGSFDPITNGHMDIVARSAKVFDKVILLLAINPGKKSRFSIEDRLYMMKEATKNYENVTVDYYNGLTVDYCKANNASHIIRGLRAVTDFEYEFQLAAANSFADDEVDTVFFMSRLQDSFISSTTISELHDGGRDISSLVPKVVVDVYARKEAEK